MKRGHGRGAARTTGSGCAKAASCTAGELLKINHIKRRLLGIGEWDLFRELPGQERRRGGHAADEKATPAEKKAAQKVEKAGAKAVEKVDMAAVPAAEKVQKAEAKAGEEVDKAAVKAKKKVKKAKKEAVKKVEEKKDEMKQEKK
jgi:hypothetical protein